MSRTCPTCASAYDDSVAFCGNDGSITLQPAAEADGDPRLGQKLGDFTVVARVADGAMGRVYEGRHGETREKVAIKVLHADVAEDRVAVERFKREYETANELASPHVVKVLGFGETGDRSFYMTMEFLQGEELGTLLRRDGKVPLPRALRILAQMALGLDDAHSSGVIHRDLKPDNLFLVRSAEGDLVRLLDFGSVKLQMETGAKLTAFGTTIGSPYYMSPEQAMGKHDLDARTDVLATAAITYEMFTGKIAFDGQAVAEILMKIINAFPPAPSTLEPSVPASVDHVIAKSLAKDKNDRHGSATEFAGEVLRAFGLDVEPGRAGVEAWAAKPTLEIEASLREAKAPEAKAPEAKAPEAKAPEAKAPEAKAPETARAPTAAPRPASEASLPRATQASFPWLPVVGLVLVVGAVLAYLAMR